MMLKNTLVNFSSLFKHTIPHFWHLMSLKQLFGVNIKLVCILGDIKNVLLLKVNGPFFIGLDLLKHFMTFFNLVVVIHVFLMFVKTVHGTQVNLFETDCFEFLGPFLLWFFCAWYFTNKRSIQLLNWISIFFVSSLFTGWFQDEVEAFVVAL